MLQALVLEDHRLMRLSVMKVVRDHFEHCLVRGAATLDLTLSLMREEDYDVVLLDLTIPPFDPRSPAARLEVAQRAINAAPASIHLVLTGENGEAEAEACRHLGASGYLSKNAFDGAVFADALAQISSGQFARPRDIISPESGELLCTRLTPREEEIINFMLQRPRGAAKCEVFRQMAERDGIDDLSCMHYYKQARAKLIRLGKFPSHA